MLSKHGRKLFSVPLDKLVPLMQASGITPNGLTVIGFLLTAVTALVLASGALLWGGVMLAIAATFDMLDGKLARATGQSSAFGAFFDSTIDRYAEGATLLALAYYYSGLQDGRTQLILLFVTLIGSLMVSYTRARAEGLGIACKSGIMQRPERIVVLILGLITGWMLPVLWVLAIMTNVTVVQRIYEVYTGSKISSDVSSSAQEDLV
jgi:CDP-diacylglycerol---glycerol-3-phosphate 3-phosphatidyltransferase